MRSHLHRGGGNSVIARARFASVASVAFVASLLSISPAAWADGSATAEQLFRQGREAMAKKDYATACRLFEESYKLEEGLGTLLNMAKCHEEEGKIGTAWGEYNSLEQKATRAGPTQRDRALFAKSRVAALEPRLTRLRVQVPADAPPGYEVFIAGNAIPPVLRAAGVIVDPGSVEVSATAPGFLTWKRDVPIEGEGQTLDVTLPKLEPEPPQPMPRRAGAGRGDAEANQGPADHSTLGWVLGGTGLFVMAGGFVAGGLALGKASDAKGCGDPCNATIADGSPNPALLAAREAYDSGKTLATVANVLIPVGAVVAAVGTYFLVTSPSRDAKTKGARVRVSPFATLGSRVEVEF